MDAEYAALKVAWTADWRCASCGTGGYHSFQVTPTEGAWTGEERMIATETPPDSGSYVVAHKVCPS